MIRTLDDVIKIYERGIPEVEAYDAVADALHYLIDYRDKKRQLEIEIAENKRAFEQLGIEKERYQEAVKNCEEAENKYRMTNDALDAQRLQMMWVDKHFAFEEPNDPLTWDELKAMERKPVWVETSDSLNRRRWMFVGEWFDDDEMRLFDMGYDYPDYVSKNDYESGRWQAYRKERAE